MNYKETLKKLHEVFPEFDLDTIIRIMDCFVDNKMTIEPLPWNTPLTTTPGPKPWDNIVYCSNTSCSSDKRIN